MKNLKNFVQAVEAKLKGEDASTVAKKIQKQADSAFKAHIASLTGDTIALEDAVESAQEALDNARINNAQTISNRNQYVQNLVAAKNNLIKQFSMYRCEKSLSAQERLLFLFF